MTGSSASPQDDETEGRLRAGPRGDSRVLLISLAISAAIHFAAVLLYPVLMGRVRPETRAPGERAPARVFRATRAVRLVEIRGEPEGPAPAEETPEPESKPASERAEEPATFPEEGPQGEAPEEPGPTAAERLRPGEGDPRIWRPVSPERTRLTDEERAELLLYGRLQALNDSLAAEGELGPNVDWTFTDGQGRRWGVSPGAIHLGGLTLPLPVFWGGGAGAGDAQEALRRQWEWSDIEAGAARASVRETLEERAKAIRERKDRERKQTGDTTGRGG